VRLFGRASSLHLLTNPRGPGVSARSKSMSSSPAQRCDDSVRRGGGGWEAVAASGPVRHRIGARAHGHPAEPLVAAGLGCRRTTRTSGSDNSGEWSFAPTADACQSRGPRRWAALGHLRRTRLQLPVCIGTDHAFALAWTLRHSLLCSRVQLPFRRRTLLRHRPGDRREAASEFTGLGSGRVHSSSPSEARGAWLKTDPSGERA
jgi:hypothetical protein